MTHLTETFTQLARYVRRNNRWRAGAAHRARLLMSGEYVRTGTRKS